MFFTRLKLHKPAKNELKALNDDCQAWLQSLRKAHKALKDAEAAAAAAEAEAAAAAPVVVLPTRPMGEVILDVTSDKGTRRVVHAGWVEYAARHGEVTADARSQLAAAEKMVKKYAAEYPKPHESRVKYKDGLSVYGLKSKLEAFASGSVCPQPLRSTVIAAYNIVKDDYATFPIEFGSDSDES